MDGEPAHRVPLGSIHAGECHAHGTPLLPDAAALSGPCNSGYGRGSCEHFPEGAKADAVRFHIIAKTSRLIRVLYIFEKECWPGAHGLLSYSRAGRRLNEVDTSAILQRQACAFVESGLDAK